MNGNLAWLDDCAYVSAQYGGRHPLAGLAIVDASRPHRPSLVKVIRGIPGTRAVSLEANEARRLVILMPFTEETPYGDTAGPSRLEVYEATQDCRRLVRVGTYDFGDVVPHEFRIAHDGKTVYATVLTPFGGAGLGHDGQHAGAHDALQVIDISNTAKPKLMMTWNSNLGPTISALGLHDLDVTADGSRAYIAVTLPAGLAIVDTSEITARKANPQLRLISQIRWPDVDQVMGFATGHTAQLATIRGRRHVLATDETPTRSGSLCPWSYARIIDVGDESNPRQVSTFRLGVNEKMNCPSTRQDDAYYSSHYIGVDDVRRTTKVFYTWYSSGLRVVDVRNPADPTEIGYYNPGAKSDTRLRDAPDGNYGNRRVDYSYSYVRYRPKLRHIWFSSVYNGFQIVELTR